MYMHEKISYLKYRHRQRELNLTFLGIAFSFNHDLTTMYDNVSFLQNFVHHMQQQKNEFWF